MEHKKRACDDEGKSHDVIPLHLLAQIEDREHHKHEERNHFLHRLEFGGGEMGVADAVGRNLQAVFEKGDQPTDEDDGYERRGLVFQMAVPGEGHENIRSEQKKDRENGRGDHHRKPFGWREG